MKQLTVVVCNNGLGHLRRVLAVIECLSKRKLPVVLDVFVDTGKLKHFGPLVEKFKKGRLRISFQHIESEVLGYEAEFLRKAKDKLGRTDYLWSDNLLFPLKYRADTVVTGSFLWCENLKRTEESRQEKELYLSRQPVVIGNKYFATPLIKSNPSFVGVGMIRDGGKPRPQKKKPYVLLSCGRTQKAREMFRRRIPRLLNVIKNVSEKVRIFVEPEFYGALNVQRIVHQADYSDAMYSACAAAVIRPGMGTVSDVLCARGRIFTFYEDGNFEVKHNARVLAELGVGQHSATVEESLLRAVQYLSDDEEQTRHQEAIKNIDCEGTAETAQKIYEIIHARKTQ